MAEEPKRKFVYRRPEGRLRSIERNLLECDWPDALHKAYHLDTDDLCQFLRNENWPLDRERREDLARLIYRRIHHTGGKGRKAGAIPSPFGVVSQHEAVTFSRVLARESRARNGGRLPLRGNERVLKSVCACYAEDGHHLGFDFDNALRELRRRPKGIKKAPAE